MKQTFNVGYLQTPSVKNLENAKQALFESGLVENTTPDEMLPDAIEEGVKKLKGQSSAPVDNGAIYEGKYRVRYFDLDGTILKIEYVANGGKTTPPDAPAYDPDYLIFDEWNYDTANYIVEQPTDIGAIYKTVDDATYMFCRFTTKTGLNPTLAISVFSSIDWGDGTIDGKVSHTYNVEGDYIIKIYGNISFTNNSTSKSLMGSGNLNKSLKKCYIKNGVTSIGDYAFFSCYSLTNITIPKSIINIGNYTFYVCSGLKSILIPNGITSIGNYVFNSCYYLANIIIPETVTSIGSSIFESCYSLTNITIPKSITSIGGNAFRRCYILTNYFINCDTTPTLSNAYVFDDINTSTIMWVNDSIIEQLKSATNWSTYANYMKPLSWYPNLTDPNA